MAGPRLGVSPIALPTAPPAVHGTPRKRPQPFILASAASLSPSWYVQLYRGRMHTVKISTLITHFGGFFRRVAFTSTPTPRGLLSLLRVHSYPSPVFFDNLFIS